MTQQQYIFSEESALPPPTIGQNDTGTQLSLGFTVATGVVKQQQYMFSEESTSPPPTRGQNDTGTQLSPGFTFATGV